LGPPVPYKRTKVFLPGPEKIWVRHPWAKEGAKKTWLWGGKAVAKVGKNLQETGPLSRNFRKKQLAPTRNKEKTQRKK